MMARRGGRTQDCGVREARERLRQAQSYIDVADLTGTPPSSSLKSNRMVEKQRRNSGS
jgi:hypothetical protein